MKNILLALFCVLAFNAVLAQQAFKLADLDFIVGSRYGELDGGIIEEHWTPPTGNTMMGAFKYHKNGKDVFYEFLVIEKTDTAVIMRLRHFSHGLIGWEEKDFAYQFSLVKAAPEYALFEQQDGKVRIAFFQRDGVFIGTHEVLKNGAWEVEEFPFDRER
ncbi:MAG: DUF6265 family protein [Saprospiraceae bacterium]|nr:DUF6265 family protein [Saprospiraceae bacterium]